MANLFLHNFNWNKPGSDWVSVHVPLNFYAWKCYYWSCLLQSCWKFNKHQSRFSLICCSNVAEADLKQKNSHRRRKRVHNVCGNTKTANVALWITVWHIFLKDRVTLKLTFKFKLQFSNLFATSFQIQVNFRKQKNLLQLLWNHK